MIAPGRRPPGAPNHASRRGAAGRSLAVLHLITRLERGGSSDCTILQALGAARRGHRVTLASGSSGAPSPWLARARAAPRLRLVEVPQLARRVSPIDDLRALASIVRIIRAGAFDVIHLHTSKAGALGRIAALLAGRRRAVIHQPHGHLFYGYFGSLCTLGVTLIERLLAPLARLHIVLSRRGAGEHLGRGIGRPAQYRVLPSGIDLTPLRRAAASRRACRARLGFADGDLVVGSLCRLEPVKGAEDLARAFLLAAATRPRLRLFLAGDGSLLPRLRDLARAAGQEGRMTVTGAWMSPAEVLPALDIFVLASRNEGMGRALVEAMAAGLPVIGCAAGGVPEVLLYGRAGLLAPPRDPGALAAAIVRLADDRILAADLGRRARARAIRFGAGRMIRTLLRLYGEVAA